MFTGIRCWGRCCVCSTHSNTVCHAGVKYSQYCAIIARTYLIDPVKQQEQEYAALVAAMEAAVKALKPGAPCSDAHAAAVKALQVGFCSSTRILHTSYLPAQTRPMKSCDRPSFYTNMVLL